MSELMPIGTIFELSGKKTMVLGYSFRSKENRFITSYIMCGFPQGFTEVDDLVVISVDAEMKMVFRGYENKYYKQFIRNKQSLYELSSSMSVDEWNLKLKEVEEIITKSVGEE